MVIRHNEFFEVEKNLSQFLQTFPVEEKPEFKLSKLFQSTVINQASLL
jgi:hypothetical protein